MHSLNIRICAVWNALARTLFAAAALSASAHASGLPYIEDTYVDGMSLRDGVLCWKHNFAGGDPAAVFRSPVLGGHLSELFVSSSYAASEPKSKTAELDSAGNAYWISQGGNVLRKGASAHWFFDPVVVAAVENRDYLASSILAVKDTRVFWGEVQGEVGDLGKVFWAPVSGGARTLVRDLSASFSSPVQILPLSDTDMLVLTSLGALEYEWEVAGTWYSSPLWPNVTSFAVANGRLYYAQRTSGGNVEIRSQTLPPGAAASTLHTTLVGAPAPNVRELVADDTNLYWHQVVAGTGDICRFPLAGGSVSTLQSAVNGDFISLLVSGPWLYWRNEDQVTIWRVATTAFPETIDLAITSTEVVQLDQDPSNSVPLVAGKPTYVRVFANIASTTGRSIVRSWPMLELHGYDPATGTELTGSPLSPNNAQSVQLTQGIPNRTTQNSASLFSLPAAWTVLPALRLTATLNPRRAVAETDYTNNTQTVTLSFSRKAPLWLEVVPLWAYNSDIFGGYDPSYEALLGRTESILPVPALYTSWRGGPPTDKIVAVWDFPPWEHRPIDLTSTFEKYFWALYPMEAMQVLNTRPPACTALNGGYHVMSFVTPGALGTFPSGGGVAGVGLVGLGSLLADMDLRSGFQAFNSPPGGPNLAHELCHNLGRNHLNIGGAGGPFEPSYPYPLNRYNDSASLSLGIDPLTGNMIPNTTSELMGYQFPVWISDFTISRILPRLPNLPIGAAVPAPRTPYSGAVTWMLNAVVSPGASQVAAPLLISDSPSVDRLASEIAAGDTSRYEFLVWHADGSSYTVPAAVADGTDAGPAGTLAIGSMSADSAATKIFIRQVGGTAALASTVGGGSPPSCTVMFPAGGETLTTPFIAKWSASDPEGSTVSTTVRYSHDNGTSWRVLEVATPLQTLKIDPSRLPGGQYCLLQFIASDGILSKIALSAPFSIPTKAPEVYIIMRNRTPQYGLATLRASAGEIMKLEARGFDAEDGLPKGYAWSVTNGYRTYNATGDHFDLPPLQPGTWSINVTAEDSDGQTGAASATLIVEPVHINTSAAAFTLDGIPDESAWLADTHPQSVPYAASDRRPPAQVRMVRSGDTLWVTGAGLMRGLNDSEFVGLSFNLDNTGPDYPQPTDVRFDICADGRVVRESGDGSGFSPVAVAGFSARVAVEPGADSWTFEAAIPVALLGGWYGQTVRLDVSHFHRNAVPDDFQWLGLDGGDWNWPTHWADVVFGADPYDPVDSDGNGIADAWELAHFGYIGVNPNATSKGGGFSNIEAFAANIAPGSPASAFSATVADSAKGRLLSWQSSLDRSYTVWASSDLVGWSPLVGPIAGTGKTLTSTLPPDPSSKKFYRVGVQWNR